MTQARPHRMVLCAVALLWAVACEGDDAQAEGEGEGASAEGEGEGEGEGAAEGEGEGGGDPCATNPADPGEAPERRAGARGVFDAPGNRLWLFGGDLQATKPAGEDPRHNDHSWERSFCPRRWARIRTPNQPVPRRRGGHALAHDEVGGRVWIHGGRTRDQFTQEVPAPEADFEMQTSLHEYNLAEDRWEPRIRTSEDLGEAGPGGRHGHSIVFDLSNERLVLFGGTKHPLHLGGCEVPPCERLRADTWYLDLSVTPAAWQRAEVEETPPRRQDHVAVLDPHMNRMLVVGGTFGPEAGQTLADVWAFDLDGGVWVDVTPVGGVPTPSRSLAAAARSASDRALVLFGGRDAAGLHNDVHALHLDDLVWAELAADGPAEAGRPEPRGEALLLAMAGGRYALWGGEGQSSLLNDLWTFSTEDLAWQQADD